MTHDDIEKAMRALHDVLDRVESGELDATAGMVARLEGALVALDALLEGTEIQ